MCRLTHSLTHDVPAWALYGQVMSEIVAKADGLDSTTRARMEGQISALQDALGR